MSELTPKHEPLNRVTHSIRAGQIVSQYGVGALVDFPDQTLMTAAPENWGYVKKIHDERLEKVLHVDYFGMPIAGGDGVAYARFPEWYFCPKCRDFKPLKYWVKEFKRKAPNKANNDPFMVRNMRCPTCNIELVVSSIVVVCEDGHIDDFPWVKWAHAKNMYGAKPICSETPNMKFPPGNSAVQGLEGMVIECKTCGAKATLRGAFGDEDTFKELDDKTNYNYKFRCTGRHPWKNTYDNCTCYPRTMQRGGTTVFFAKIESSLVIPPFSSLLTARIEGTNDFEECRTSINTINELDILDDTKKQQAIITKINECSSKIAERLGENKKQIEEILKRKFIGIDEMGSEGTQNIKYRIDEYEALNGEMNIQSNDEGDFKREEIDIDKYKNIPFISKISLIHKIREVIALTGYSRIRPAEGGAGEKSQVTVVSIKEPETKWYPANEVRGEGIFIELDENAINQWRTGNEELEKRVNILNENYSNSFIGKNSERVITGKYLLLHTLSHLLIKQLSFECGYNVASLKERIYCSEQVDGKVMSGILIYTADGDSEGSLGGLVRQGRPDTFPKIYKKAVENAVACSNDPVCNLSMGQGRDFLNLAACHACSLLPETSCETFNTFLDRATLVGTFDNPQLGFFYNQLYGDEGWNCEMDNSTRDVMDEDNDVTTMSDNVVNIIDEGSDLKGEDIKNIFEDLLSWSEDEIEKMNIKAISEQIGNVSEEGILFQDVLFSSDNSENNYYCDFYWRKKKVALFLQNNEDGYEVAKNTQWKCYLCSKEGFDLEQFIKDMEGE